MTEGEEPAALMEALRRGVAKVNRLCEQQGDSSPLVSIAAESVIRKSNRRACDAITRNPTGAIAAQRGATVLHCLRG